MNDLITMSPGRILLLKFRYTIFELFKHGLAFVKCPLSCSEIFLTLSIGCFTSCEFLFACCELSRSCCIVSFALCEFSLAISESLLTFCNLIKSIEICLLVVLELIESVLQLVHVSCGLFACFFPIIFAVKNVIQIYCTAVESE